MPYWLTNASVSLAAATIFLFASMPVIAQEELTIGVMQFAAKGDIDQGKADVLAEVLAEKVTSMGDVTVVTEFDLLSVLTDEDQRLIAGCDDDACLIEEVGGALGMSWMVTGNVSRFGESYILNLKLLNLRSTYVVGRVTRRITGDEEELLEELLDATEELFNRVAERLGLAVQKRVTVAARHPQPLSQSPSAVWVITRDDIEASGADSLPNLLRLVPGMDVIVSSGALQSITSRLHWTNEGHHYLVLIDGREINFGPLGFPVWEVQPIFLEDIERIEVIMGPASALYGTNAFSGVVSITTREMPGRNSARVLVRAGEAGRAMTGLRAFTKLGEWGFAVSGGADHSAEFTDTRRSDKRMWKLRAFLERRWSESKRFLIDAGMSYLEGPASSTMGTVQSVFAPSSVRLAYESEDLLGQLYWTFAKLRLQIDTPIEYAGIHLASFVSAPTHGHVVDAQLQWTPPGFWEPLRLIVGGGARVSWVGSDTLLDGETFADPSSQDYHKPGISYWETRAGAFVQAEYPLADWATLTGGTRIDYNTRTEWFVSPRLAAVLQPASDHYLRMGVARSFRKPAFLEIAGHMQAKFPDTSPIQGAAQYTFQEFMTRVGGNEDIDNEELLAFEAGYLGRFLDGQLSVGLDLYYNRYRNRVVMVTDLVEDEMGLPDLEKSSYSSENQGPDMDILGSELSVRFTPVRNLSFLASWSHRQVYDYSLRGFSGESPKNLITLGGRFRTTFGLLGSLYAFARSEFWFGAVENPAGILQGLLRQHVDSVFLLIGKLGHQFELGRYAQLETGVKLFLPVSPFSAPHFGYNEDGGGITPFGERYGAEQLGRVLTVYLEGSF